MILGSRREHRERLEPIGQAPLPQPAQATKRAAFFQLAGHKECFKLGSRPDTILKKSTGNEAQCLRQLMADALAPFVPKIFGSIQQANGELYLEMEDLLASFRSQLGSSNFTSVMDIKMGSRTYCEEELTSALREAKLRPDMYDKMVEIDLDEPTEEERAVGAITKPRYMVWRETVSSTASLGFRIEAMRLAEESGLIDKDFKTTKEEEEIKLAFIRYTKSNIIRSKYLNRLYELRKVLMKSKFFHQHELIGSSLLFVHNLNLNEANIWLIDFAKTHKIPNELRRFVTHRRKWELGNHEDGYLIGIDNLIRIFEAITKVGCNDSPTSIKQQEATKQFIGENKILSGSLSTNDTNSKQQPPNNSQSTLNQQQNLFLEQNHKNYQWFCQTAKV